MILRSVYVVKSELGPVKIGIATEPKARLSSLRTASAVPLSLAFVGECDAVAAKVIESRAHGLLTDVRMRGEWFSTSVETAIAAVMQAAEELGFEIKQIDHTPEQKPPKAPKPPKEPKPHKPPKLVRVIRERNIRGRKTARPGTAQYEFDHNLIDLTTAFLAGHEAKKGRKAMGIVSLSKLVAAGDSFFLTDARNPFGRSYTVRKYDEIIERFVKFWPEGAVWPPDVPRG